jgi:serine O-acetyltransferase
MKSKIISLWILLNVFRSIPAILAYQFSPSKGIIDKDIKRWVKVVLKDSSNKPTWKYLHLLLLNYKEYRNLFYYRIKKTNFLTGKFIEIFYPSLNSLFLSTADIGAGFVIHHGFSTIIYAKRIGENVTVAQQVTVGMVRDNPTIEDGVQITAGACVVGGITVGKNSIVGANATVTKNVPENCVVVGNPAFIVKRNGVKTKEELKQLTS